MGEVPPGLPPVFTRSPSPSSLPLATPQDQVGNAAAAVVAIPSHIERTSPT